MDSYPEDLLVGVFPLVFAVSTIVENEDEGDSPTHRRSLFDRFLDAVAASLIDDANDPLEAGAAEGTDKRRQVSLFRPDEEEESSDEEETEDIFGGVRRRSGSLSAGLYGGFGRRTLTRVSSGGSEPSNEKASYAKALTHGQGFFQRARIESVGTRHGFPPSKDPGGTENLAFALQPVVRTRNVQQLNALFEKHPLEGILPAGWLEKHVHALPSAILVVCTVCSSQKNQAEQDENLYKTVEHLRYSLVPKRQCKIHVVGLMQDDVTMIQADEWSRAVASHMFEVEEGPPPPDPPFRVTLLRASSDLQSNDTGLPFSQALRRLHRNVRDASLTYYLGQARRTKQKLAKLTEDKRRNRHDSPPPQLLPLAIRYCFKIAIFYEFQWKHEKSLRFMAAAYRHVTEYYQYLLTLKGTDGSRLDEDRLEAVASHSMTDSSESVEVALSDNMGTFDSIWRTVTLSTPDDMIHQCRSVADWLNLKLLSAGFTSHTEGGLLAASNQWRRHSRLFCTRRHAAAFVAPEWFEWSYIAHQRLVMSQLVERHPPTALGDLGNEYDEVLLRCSPWRTYESAAEAMLRLGREVSKIKSNESDSLNHAGEEAETSNRMRPPFVGGMDSEGLAPELQRESKVNHREKALDLILRAISIFERELEREKRGFYAEDHFSEHSASRTGARLYYLAGGTLLGMERHEEAAGYLAKAAKLSKGWREVELAVRRLLIECYEKHIPSQSDASESSETIASMILDSYFNAEMSSSDLRRALDHFASMTAGESLKWYHETVEEEDYSVPFSFAVTFPGTTHATAGDSVKVSVFIKSNLDYATHINSVTLLSLAGQLPIPANDLLSATNASEGHEGGIIIQAQTSIVLSTELELPKDLSIIAADESGNGGEAQGVAGRGSFAKSARPRTAGITSAGGARLLHEEQLPRLGANSQGWSVRFLGGKPLRCDGLRLLFYPVQAARAGGGTDCLTKIELTIEKKKPKTVANIRRTPFEEQNYIASAWSRPLHIPFPRGPRCLRVLGPQPNLVITNITDTVTNGNALEGTVNRILLKLQAGPCERCSDLQFRVSCFTVLMTPTGTTKRLVPEAELSPESEGSVNMKNPAFRTPALVEPSPKSSSLEETPYGYGLPEGWSLAGSGQAYNGPNLGALKGGESVFAHLDLYRPAPLAQRSNSSSEASAEDIAAQDCLCKTDFYVTVTYRQERPAERRPKLRKRVSRRRPRMQGATKGIDNDDSSAKEQEESANSGSDEVSLEYTGSVVWVQPMTASFSAGTQNRCPSGRRHSSNSAEGTRDESDGECAFIDGECVTARCSLQADTKAGLTAEVVAVRFEDDNGLESPLELTLKPTGSSDGDGTLVRYEPGDPCRLLSQGTKLSVGFSVQVNMKSAHVAGGVSSTLGALSVDWLPSKLDLPVEARDNSDALGSVTFHGPLALSSPSRIHFSGPPCYVEQAPFEAKLESTPSVARVAVPFELNYRIKNKTNTHQTISVKLNDPRSVESEGLLVSGLVNGELSLAARETQILSYTVLATKAGKIALPGLQVSSTRYRTFVVNELSTDCRLYIFP